MTNGRSIGRFSGNSPLHQSSAICHQPSTRLGRIRPRSQTAERSNRRVFCRSQSIQSSGPGAFLTSEAASIRPEITIPCAAPGSASATATTPRGPAHRTGPSPRATSPPAPACSSSRPARADGAVEVPAPGSADASGRDDLDPLGSTSPVDTTRPTATAEGRIRHAYACVKRSCRAATVGVAIGNANGFWQGDRHGFGMPDPARPATDRPLPDAGEGEVRGLAPPFGRAPPLTPTLSRKGRGRQVEPGPRGRESSRG